MDSIAEKENIAPTTSNEIPQRKDASLSPRKSGRKGRSKSIGPGSLDEPEPPRQSAKDRRKSLFAPATRSILSKNEESERAARRKSMMNRRVSFAPEATLHTWDIIDYAKDHTTSTESADSTRRASHFSRASASPAPSSDASQHDEDAELLTPETSQHGSQDSRQRRRGSGTLLMELNDPADALSPGGMSDTEESGSDDGEEEESDGDTDTAMSLDVDDATMQSNAASDNSTGSSDGLEARLRQAAQMAGTRGIEYDEFGEMSMELAGEEITNAFKPWAQRLPMVSQGSASMDQENINPFSPAFKAEVEEQQPMSEDEDTGEDDISMDVTRAVGGIVRARQDQEQTSSPMTDNDGTMELTQAVGMIMGQKRRRSTTDTGSPSGIVANSQASKRRRSSVARSSMGDDTMDLTMAVGGIKNTKSPAKSERRRSARNRRSSGAVSLQEDVSMDLTQAVGAIKSRLNAIQAREDESFDGNEELSMELTAVLGSIPPRVDGSPTSPQKPQSPARATANSTADRPERFGDAPELGAEQLLTPVLQKGTQQSSEKQKSSSKSGSKARASLSPVRPVSTQAATEATSDQDIRVDSQGSPKAIPKQPSPGIGITYPDLPLVDEHHFAKTETPSPTIARKSPRRRGTNQEALDFRLEAAVQAQRNSSPKKAATRTPEKLDSTEESKDLSNSFRLLITPRKEALKTVTPKKQSAVKQASPLKMITPRGRPTPRQSQPTTAVPSPVRRLQEDIGRLRANGHTSESVGLQDFLNKAGIRFMDLTTTKRRLTVAPTPSKARNSFDDTEEVTLENSVAAAACTVPELELYQHACHELKRYTREGKQMIADLEAATAREQPPLIEAYMNASPERKSVLDAQMRDMKTDARLHSKELWYGWRSQLLNELLTGLGRIGEELIEDDEKIAGLEETLERLLPDLSDKRAGLQREVDHLEDAANAVPEVEKEELNSTRRSLSKVNAELEEKRRILNELRQQAEERESETEHLKMSKEEFNAAIQEANRVREACRGVSMNEITTLQESVKHLEDTFGWSITSASSSPSTITMVYRSELQLFFHPRSFQQSTEAEAANQPIRLSYVADAQRQTRPLTTTLRFFLQLLQATLQSLPQCTTKISDLLALVSGGWETACAVQEGERRLNLETMTHSRIVSDEKLAIESTILLPKVRSKVRATIALQALVGPDLRLSCSIEPAVLVVYGEQYNEKNMTEYLRNSLGGSGNDGLNTDAWDSALRQMREKLVARGAKGSRK